ncbi:MAG TPA: flagellar hook basal-body protein [Ignavibacteriaceae bacterium]|jgi:flagellar basal-body rod protein FlgG|nr:flagellar hook basal-body protein [Ignavibacteriaceae bacterium]
MINSIYEAAKNLHLKTKNIDIVSNNLANLNSIGYKRQLPFAEIMSRIDLADRNHLTDFSEGSFIQTGNPLDFAVSGSGFLVYETENGLELSKNGKLTISDDGFLINENGLKLLGESGAIQIMDDLHVSGKSLTVSRNGEVRVGDKVVDKLLVGKITDAASVIRANNQNFVIKESNLTVAEEEDFAVYQSALEESNVNPFTEMQSLIELNKNFETTQKMVGYFDNHLSKVNEVGKV